MSTAYEVSPNSLLKSVIKLKESCLKQYYNGELMEGREASRKTERINHQNEIFILIKKGWRCCLMWHSPLLTGVLESGLVNYFWPRPVPSILCTPSNRISITNGAGIAVALKVVEFEKEVLSDFILLRSGTDGYQFCVD